MYNGIGLTTPRGSGTNGYVIRNLSTLRSHETGQDRSSAWDVAPPKHREPDQGILDHERKRQVEVKCLELQLELEEKELEEEEIEKQVDALRTKLNANLAAHVPSAKSLKPSDTHGIALAKKSELDRMARALGTRRDYSEGEAFDREKQKRTSSNDKSRGKSGTAEKRKSETGSKSRRKNGNLRGKTGGDSRRNESRGMPPPPPPSDRDGRYRGRDKSPPRGPAASRAPRRDSRSRSPRRDSRSRSPPPRSQRSRRSYTPPAGPRSRQRSASPPRRRLRSRSESGSPPRDDTGQESRKTTFTWS
ncbi:cwf21-domain-containing protein [Gymnopus androsaceus JB14]|uniref:Cwf21-domain-containing protein n=1 Tax=Gymnopus androsaceus JB14 TaxID=1447944 RepID=A0A6A4GNL0_9AGAR|nr:cwf21-domain-containing protein [Gymnopus androsaceus JB14]